jgi:putative PEP-CTERM system histidine kinase
MSIQWIIAISSATYSAAVAAFVFSRAPRHPAHISFAIGMLILAGESLVSGLITRATSNLEIIKWQNLWMMLASFVPAPWLLFSVCYARGDHEVSIRRWRAGVLGSLLIPCVLYLAANGAVLTVQPGTSQFRLPWAGVSLNLASIVGLVLILTNLERTFRGSVGIMRWRIKYMMLGLGVLFVFRLYSETQTLLYSTLEPTLQQVASGVLLLSCLLMSISLFRNKLFDVDVYPSHAVLYRSLTVLLTGIYLVVVGFVAQVVKYVGSELAFPFRAFLVLVALVALAVALLSERIRRQLHQFVSRHFRRPVYDYRQAWSTFTAQTGSKVDEGAFSRAVVTWMAETFRVLSVNVWILSDNKDRFRLGGSTALTESTAAELESEGQDWSPLIRAMVARPLPVDIDETTEQWVLGLRQLNPGFFPEAGNRVCMPLCAGDELLAVLILGDRVSGLPFSTEDLDLLKCVGDQVAAGLLRFQLSRRLLGAKELEAFQTMSAFFVHDLKNTASTLSLMLQNLRDHFGNPDFREDALRAVGRSVQHLDELIGRLSQLRQELRMNPEPKQLSAVVERAISQAGVMPQVEMRIDFQPIPDVQIDGEQFLKVVLNLILNARDAMDGRGQLRLGVSATNDWATLTVSDTGAGMSPEFIRKSLFRPFQTTKKRGLGIGMFQSKMIVDGHGGRMEVESTLGVGTTFRVHLPLN